MKKILLLIPLLLSFLIGVAQPEINRQPSPSNTLIDQAVFMKINFRPPVFADTTAANAITPKLDSCGRQIFTYNTNSYWLRACSPKKWVEVGRVVSIASSNSILVTGDGSAATPFTPTLIVSPQNNNAVVSLPSGVFVPTQVQNGLIEGGILTWVSGYTYDVSPARYGISNVVYNTLQDQITFAAADTLPRIDEAAVDINEDVVVIQGVASELPTQEPSYDPSTQVPLAFVTIDSNSTEPEDIKEEYIYKNNVEWTTSSSNVGRINPDATNNPYSDTKDIRMLLTAGNDSIGFTAPIPPTMSDYTVITFKIFITSAWLSNQGIILRWYNGLTAVGNPIVLSNNVYGLNTANNGTYQTITIRLSDFNSIPQVTNLRITAQAFGGNTMNADIDDIRLLGGDGVIIPQVGDDWHVGGNVLASTGRFGSITPNNVDIITGNTLKATVNNTTSQFEFYGNLWLRGTNGGVSYYTGSFANSDYFTQRQSNILVTNVPGGYALKFAGNNFYTFDKVNGHLWKDSLGTSKAQLLPTGALRLFDYGDNLFTGTATRWLAVDVNGNVIEQTPPSGISAITADNGLTANTNTNVRLGGTLLQSTTINSGTFGLTLTGAVAGNSMTIVNTEASGLNYGLYATASGVSSTGLVGEGGNAGVQGLSLNGSGGTFNSTNGYGINASSASVAGGNIQTNQSSTNTSVSILDIVRASSGTAANNIGGYISYSLETSTGAAQQAGTIGYKWTDATNATRTSQFVLQGVNSTVTADLLTISGIGSARLNKYGVGSFTAGTPAYGLAVDASGNIIEAPVGGGIAAVTANNGLSVSSITNVQLGGSALVQNSTISTSAFNLTINSSNGGSTLTVNNTSGSGAAIEATGNGNAGVVATSTNESAIVAFSTNLSGIFAQTSSSSFPAIDAYSFPTSTNTITPIIYLNRNTTGTAANNIGLSLDLNIETSTGIPALANQIISKLTTANNATRVSEFSITGVDNAVTSTLFTISGSGSTRLNKYGINTFAGVAAYVLGVDASGNIVEVAAAGAGMANVLTTTGDIIYSSSGSTPARLGIGTNGDVLTVVGGVPVWQSIGVGGSVSTVSWTGGIVSIANPTTAPAFTIAGTSGGGVYFSSSSAWASTGVLAANSLMIGGGAGSAYSTTTTGTGVLTALGINVGSAGAFVTFNGAGGTPSTITLTNAIGLPLSTGIIGTLADDNGGTGQSTYTTGQILYASASNTLSKLSIGITGQVLTVVGGVPVWTTPSTGGTVQDVTGTSNRITITGTATINPVVDISATYVGQTSIIMLGTITTGTWNGTAIGATFGGTSFTTYTTGDLIYASATNTLSKRTIGSNGQVLTVSGGVPTWVTPGTGGTVTAFSFTNANGFTGTVSTPNTTPALTIGTTLVGMLRGTGTGMAAVTSSTAGQVLVVNGANSFTFSALNLAAPAAVTGVLPAISGGTGVGTPFNNGVLLIGNGTGWTKANLTAGNGISIVNSAGGITISSNYANAWVTVTESGSTINWNTTTGANARVTLSGTGRTLNIQNPIDGYVYTLRVIQGSGGLKTITTWTNVQWPGGTLPDLSDNVGQYDIFQFKYEALTGLFYGSVGLNYN